MCQVDIGNNLFKQTQIDFPILHIANFITQIFEPKTLILYFADL